jgi:hypothetical protein
VANKARGVAEIGPDQWAPSEWEMSRSPQGAFRSDRIVQRWPSRFHAPPVDEWYAFSRRRRRRLIRVLAGELGGFFWFFATLLTFRALGLLGANFVGVGAGLLVAGAYLRSGRSSWDRTSGNSLFTPNRVSGSPSDFSPIIEVALRLSGLEARDVMMGSVSHGGGKYKRWLLRPSMQLYLREGGSWPRATIQLIGEDSTSLPAFVQLKTVINECFASGQEAHDAARGAPAARVVP